MMIPYETFDFSKITASDAYRLMIGAIVPRPIAFVSTVDSAGTVNLAPFSFFNGVSSVPPCLMIAVSRHENGDKKDTLKNIEFTNEFVVNSTHEWIADEVNQTAAEFPYGESEMDAVGFHAIPSLYIRPPRISEAWIHFECRVEKFVEIGEGTAGSSTLVIGRILAAHISPDAMTEGRIDYAKFKPLARLGGSQWMKSGTSFSIKRPQ